MNLNPLNVRKGLELEEVEVYDIFHIDTESFGEPEAKTIHEIGWSSYSKNNKNNPVIKKIKDESGVIYFTHKIERDVTETLKAFIYDCYMVFVDKLDTSIVSSSLNTEIQFVNTKTLDFSQFCKNLMEAQAFCGDYNIPDLKYSFAGHGDFTIQDYSDVHHLVIFSRIHMLDFFITYKNILSSIGFFVTGLFEEDVKQQKEYLTEKEYKSLMRECKKQKKLVVENINKIKEENENLENGGYDDEDE